MPRRHAFMSVVAGVLALGAAPVGAGVEDGEAQSVARHFMEGIETVYDDGTTFSHTHSVVPMMDESSDLYWQYSNFGWTLDAESITSSDRLNGLTWKGRIHPRITSFRKLYRSRSSSSEPLPGCWEAWQDAEPSYNDDWRLRRQNGQWSFDLIADNTARFAYGPGESAPTREDIAAILKVRLCSQP